MEVLIYIIVFTFIFRQLYNLFCRFSILNSPSFCSRYVSCIHAVTLVTLGILWENGYSESYWWTILARAVPVGYLLHDSHIICREHTLWSFIDLIHHMLFLFLILYAVELYPYHTSKAFLAESSVPFINIGWYMLKTKMNNSYPRIFIINALITLITFLIFRVCIFTVFTYDAINLKAWLVLPMVFGMTVLNWYWFILLIRKAFKIKQL